jgi:endonuclease YncB( thermonuclease family)
MRRAFLPLTALFLLAFIAPVAAQQKAQGGAFSTPALAADAQTLSAPGNMTILLWGMKAASAADTPDGIRARVYLDDLIGGRPVRCLTMAGTAGSGATIRARCLNADERDLSLLMIGAGLATANRAEINASELGAAYLNAERQARMGRQGLWNAGGAMPVPVAAAPVADAATFGGVPLWAIAGALLVVPVLGFLIIGLIMHFGLRQLIVLQRYQIAGTQKRERQLKEREKYVIASALEGELMTNRAKLDAFLVIYEELLKSLRDPSKTPKYQRAGDIIHEKPALTRTVYDAHIDKLELLGPQLASDLSHLYNLIVPNPDYRTLEPEVPIAKAQEMVDRIVRNAEKLIEPMDKVVGALAVIVRDKRGALTALE